MKKDGIFKKFIFILVIGLCAFALAAGIRTAYDRTSAQLFDNKTDKIYENDVMEYIEEKIFAIM